MLHIPSCNHRHILDSYPPTLGLTYHRQISQGITTMTVHLDFFFGLCLLQTRERESITKSSMSWFGNFYCKCSPIMGFFKACLVGLIDSCKTQFGYKNIKYVVFLYDTLSCTGHYGDQIYLG